MFQPFHVSMVFEFVYEFNDLGDVCKITDIHTNAVCTIEYY